MVTFKEKLLEALPGLRKNENDYIFILNHLCPEKLFDISEINCDKYSCGDCWDMEISEREDEENDRI